MFFFYSKRNSWQFAPIFCACLILVFASPPLSTQAEERMREMRYGIFAHDIEDRDEKGVDINITLLYESTDWLAKLKSPRPLIGLSVNTSGETSQLYTGLAWQIPLPHLFYAEIMFGLSLHTGETTRTVAKGKRALGCSVLFREEFSVGYNLDATHTLMATVSHVSNADLCHRNAGLTNVGLRYTYHY